MHPEIIIGPPGCGKTEALLAEVELLLTQGLEPEEIALLTFTRRAAAEAVKRAADKFKLDAKRFTWFRTLHSLCFRAMGLSRSDVLTGSRLTEFADWSGVRLSRHNVAREEGWSGSEPGDRILHLDHLARVSGRPLQEVFDTTEHELQWSEVRRVSEDLRNFKHAKGLLDYTDMLHAFHIHPPWKSGIRAVLVDEAQDLSMLQWRVLERLRPIERLVVAGDDDQSIYEWAGAAVEHFVGLPGQTRVLGQSWRVPRTVQALAAEVIGRVEARRPKEWVARDEEGEVDWVPSIDDVDISGETLVLARNHLWLERDVAPVLRREGIWYEVRGEPSLPRDTLTLVRGWEAWRRGESVAAELAADLLRWLPSGAGRRPRAGEETVSAADLGVTAEAPWHTALTRMPEDDVSYILSMRQRGESLVGQPSVRLSTIHAAKGGQADHVVLLTDMTVRSAEEARRLPDAEARVWYVGLTRARLKLTVVERPSAPHKFSLAF